jgi:putative endopeptidase
VYFRQANEYDVYGVKLNGKLTCGENIADLGGLKLALRALNNRLKDSKERGPALTAINGFSPQQRLFLAWSQVWRGSVTEERAKQLVTLDPHGPNTLRCNGTLSNIQEFFDAFDISEGKMFRPVEDRVDIW